MIETLQRRHETVGSDAFRIEYERNLNDAVLINDIVSYLGEYRFKLPNFCYRLDYVDGQLIDLNRRESMVTLSQRAIDVKNHQNKSSSREQAEKIGFQKLGRELRQAKTGDTIIWMSPQGPKSEGYGDYGYIYFGKVEGDGHEKKISMIAKRVDESTIEQFNQAREAFFGSHKKLQKAEEFLVEPAVLKENISEAYVDSVLKKIFTFKPSGKIQRIFEKVIENSYSLITDLVALIKNPWKAIQEKIKGLHSLENFVLKLRKDYESEEDENLIYIKSSGNDLRIKDIVGSFGHEPPKVAGSCGSTSSNSLNSSNIFNSLSSLNSLFNENEWFQCPECGFKADGPVGNTCPGCGLTKEAYAEEAGVSCD